ncbi:MAG: hypothetical protein SGJ18_06725 [Pseudomonadota bacterium]|nr:hypothetical protein [Pseudomonadota bacterium]
MQQKKPGILEQIFYESEKYKISRRKVSEALRRVRNWFKREFRASEPLPPEFKDFQLEKEIDRNRAKDLWQKYF